ncbi:hypothetical protein, partial [Agrobacterium fabrum]|uniref:hypothetical protein n=1 Tax=Agrobacterium fabrum TaxID=1176649 RepID=UPI001A91C997
MFHKAVEAAPYCKRKNAAQPFNHLLRNKNPCFPRLPATHVIFLSNHAFFRLQTFGSLTIRAPHHKRTRPSSIG